MSSYALGKNILATVTYYDVLDYPLTGFEIWKHLISFDRENAEEAGCSLGTVEQALRSEAFSGKIERENGFVFLPGRRDLVADRIQREKVSARKLRGMHRLAKLIAYVPFVRMVGATGSLAMKHGGPKSDWDMFVVMKAGRIWLGRTALTGFLHMIGKRRHGTKVVDRACLNYFVTEENLEIGTKDLYSAHEYRFIIPLFGRSLFRRFQLSNAWIRDFKPNMLPADLMSRFLVPEEEQAAKAQRFFERVLETLTLEAWLASWQQKKIEKNPKTRIEGSFIEASDRALIFLPKPRGPRVFEKFKERFHTR